MSESPDQRGRVDGMTTQHKKPEMNQLGRLRCLFQSMPYGGSCSFRYPAAGDEWTVDLLEHNIRALHASLVRASVTDQANTRRLDKHDRLFGALGELVRLIADEARPEVTP